MRIESVGDEASGQKQIPGNQESSMGYFFDEQLDDLVENVLKTYKVINCDFSYLKECSQN